MNYWTTIQLFLPAISTIFFVALLSKLQPELDTVEFISLFCMFLGFGMSSANIAIIFMEETK